MAASGAVLAERLGVPEEGFQERRLRLNDEWEVGRIGSYGEMLEAVCRESGHEPPDSVIADLVRELTTEAAVPFANIDPAIPAMLRAVKAMGLPVGVVSNVENLYLEGWATCQLAPLMEHVVASFDVGVMKPDPLIYRRGLKPLEVSADEAVFIGDSRLGELSGAERVGMTPVWATWFVDKWPPAVRRWPFEPYPRMRTPGELVDWLRGNPVS